MHRLVRRVVVFGLLLAGTGNAFAQLVHGGFSGLWMPTDRSGEGWSLEIIGPQQALLYWYTYDSNGRQRWLMGLGVIDDDRIDFPELLVTSGGRFGPAFDAGAIVRQVVGNASMQFDDCLRGHFEYQMFGQQQRLPIERLTMTADLPCPTGEVPAPRRTGQSGSWYDTARSGEGYSLQWLVPDETAIVTWFTYDPDGNQYWMIGVGHHRDGLIVFPELGATRGARFGVDFDPADVERFVWGELRMDLNCGSGWVEYDARFPEFGSGRLPATRLSSLDGLDCGIPPSVDLSSAMWQTTASAGPRLSEMPVAALGDDIYVAGGLTSLTVNSSEFWRYRPSADAWTRLPDLPARRDHGMLAAVDDQLYFAGGYSQALTAPSRNAWRFDPPAARWTAITDMPGERAAGAAAGLDGRLYLTTGNVMNRYDPGTDRWTIMPMNDPAARDHSAMVAYRGELWLLGGRDLFGVEHATVTIFNPRTGLSRPGPSMIAPRSGLGAAVIGDHIVVAGGESLSPPAMIPGAIAYSPQTGSWFPIAAPGIDVHGATAATVSGRLYLMLGSTVAGRIVNPGRVQALIPPDS